MIVDALIPLLGLVWSIGMASFLNDGATSKNLITIRPEAALALAAAVIHGLFLVSVLRRAV